MFFNASQVRVEITGVLNATQWVTVENKGLPIGNAQAKKIQVDLFFFGLCGHIDLETGSG